VFCCGAWGVWETGDVSNSNMNCNLPCEFKIQKKDWLAELGVMEEVHEEVSVASPTSPCYVKQTIPPRRRSPRPFASHMLADGLLQAFTIFRLQQS
jgi:hypothetical protein